MKATIFSNRMGRYLLAAMLLLPLGGILFVSCEKEKAIVEVPDPQPPPPLPADRPDEVNDLVAWFNPLESVFLIDPAYTEQVLASVQAQPFDNGSYQFNGVNLLGEPRLIQFRIKPVKIPDIYYTATAVEQALGPDLDHTYVKNGTSHSVYKNALCGKVQKGFEGICVDSASISKKDIYYDNRRCERGTGYCLEVLLTWGTQRRYDNNGCQGPFKEKPIPGPSCHQ